MLRKDAGFSGTILSFEPNPDIFAQLCRRAASDAKWHVFNVALSDFDGTASFNIMAADQFSSLKKPAQEQDAIFADRNRVTRTVEMQCRRIDGLLPELREAYSFARPFLKMDTQGHDLSVCNGAAQALQEMAGVQTELGVRPIYGCATGISCPPPFSRTIKGISRCWSRWTAFSSIRRCCRRKAECTFRPPGLSMPAVCCWRAQSA
jgi:FkbM family methyltransferase